MPIVVNLDLVLAKQQMKGKAVAELVGISQQNFSLLRTGKLCGVLECQPGDILEYQSD
jgi:putative transcriptional regulator